MLGRPASRRNWRISLSVAALCTAIFTSGNAEDSPAQYDVEAVPAEVLAAADALGLVRGIRNAATATAVSYEIYDGIVDGLIDGVPLDEVAVRLSVDYLIPAVRIDQRVNRDGEAARTIVVARGDRGWNESAPGIASVEITDPNEVVRRLLFAFVLPTGAVSAAVRAGPDAVKIDRQDGQTHLEFEFDELHFNVLLDSENRPGSISVNHPDVSIAANFYEYQDFEGYFVMHPSRIEFTESDGSQWVMQVEQALMNPYVAFPLPEQIR